MVPAVRPLGSLSMARGCARIVSRPDTAKIGSADRVEVHHARLLAVIGVRKTFPHGLDPKETSQVTSIIATVCARPLSPRSITVLSEVVGPTCGNVFFNLSGGLL